jgi:hypothetical protein
MLAELEEARRAVAQAAGAPEALALAMAGLEETFTRLTGKPPQHNQGQTYAARGLVYEDCRRDLDAALGPELLARLGPPLTLFLRAARWTAGALTAAIEERLAQIHADLARQMGSGTVPSHAFFAQALTSLFLKRERDPVFVAVARDLQERWARVLDLPVPAGRRVRLSSGVLAARVEEAFGTAGRTWSLARYFSPDVMIAAAGKEALERGDYELVLGEVHSGNTLMWSCFQSQHPAPEEILRALALDVEGRVLVLPQMLKQSWTQRMNVATPPGFYRYQFADDPPAHEDSRLLPAGGLVVEAVDGRLRCRTRDGGTVFDAIDLFSQNLTLECSAILGVLLPPQRHSPRITIDEMVLARERWRFTVPELEFAFLEDAAARFLGARRWAQTAGLPRFCFFKVGTERKPCYLDLDSPLYVDIFAHLVRSQGRAADTEAVSVTEMFPGLDKIWLADAAGDLYTCELRMTALDGNDRAAGGGEAQ